MFGWLAGWVLCPGLGGLGWLVHSFGPAWAPSNSFCRYLLWVRSWVLIVHTFSKLGRGVFVAIYRGCAPGSYLCIFLVRMAEQFLSLFVVGALLGANCAYL